MKVNIVAVGTVKEAFFKQAILEYQKRLTRFCNFNIIEVKESPATNLATIIKDEGESLNQKLKGLVVALDIKGKMLDSPEIAEYINAVKPQGKDINFVIGGSNGLSTEIIKNADLVLSFGKITYPHQLMRVVLTEQIYRAFTILENIKYHK